MDLIEGLLLALVLVIVAVFGLWLLSYFLAQKGRLTAEMKQAIDKSAADYGVSNVTLIGDSGVPCKVLTGKIRLIPNYTSHPATTLVRIQNGWWLLAKVRYIQLLKEEHSNITSGEPLLVATTSFRPVGNTGFEVTANYPIGTAVSNYSDQTLPYALKQTADAYGQIANKLIEINLTHQEAMERGGGLVKIMGGVKDSIGNAIPKPPK